MGIRKILVGVVVVALAVLVAVAPASAGKPKSGDWFSDTPVNPKDEDNLSTIQFKVANGKKLKQLTIYWKCGKAKGYHNFTNMPFPVTINKKKKFKVVGAMTPPKGTGTKDFTLKGKFTSRKKGNFSMKLEKCGPKTKGQLSYVGG